MTDERIRDYERKARAGRDPALDLRGWIEAARNGRLPHVAAGPLVERLARGELDRERLALAAYAGHEGALSLLEEETVEYAAFVGDLAAVHVVHGDDVTYEDLEAWLPGLERRGRDARLMAELAIGRLLLDGAAAECAARSLGRRLQYEDNYDPTWELRAEAELLETEVAGGRGALEAAERLVRREDPILNRQHVAELVERWSQHGRGFGWSQLLDAVDLTLRSAVEGRVDEPPIERFGTRGRSTLRFCEHARFQPREVAAAVKRALAAFTLRREHGPPASE